MAGASALARPLSSAIQELTQPRPALRRDARKEFEQKRASDELRKQEQLVKQQAAASARLGAGARGYKQRKAAQKEQKQTSKSAVLIQARFRGQKERSDPAAEVNVRRARNANDPQTKAEAYLKEHKLMVRARTLHAFPPRPAPWPQACPVARGQPCLA